jgi:hypothetical protein
MSGYQKNMVKKKLTIVWTIAEVIGLIIILVFYVGIVLLAFKTRFSIWKWLSLRRFRKTIRKAGIKGELEEKLVSVYSSFLDENMSFNRLLGINSLSELITSSNLVRSAKIH